MENSDLKFLKKHYGEKFARFCRTNFPTALETEGLLSNLISKKFAPSRALYEDIICNPDAVSRFKGYINFRVRRTSTQIDTKKTPEELMSEAGYILYPECRTYGEIYEFQKYYALGEELCTFHADRLETCRVWFAVKKDVDDIRREDFKNPERQDRYGTSVISIQFTKNTPITLSIKNRYNHTVKNPDATFSNDLENIIPGLTSAFEQTYNMDLSYVKGEDILYMDDYTPDENGTLYKVNVDNGREYFCENNIVIDSHGHVIKYDKSRYILMDDYIVDLQQKTIKNYAKKYDAFLNSLGEVKDVRVSRNIEGNKVVIVTPKNGEDIFITLNDRNGIIGLENNNVEVIGDDFLSYNKTLKYLKMDNLKVVGHSFLYSNEALGSLTLNNLERCATNFLCLNKILSEFHAEKLEFAGCYFLDRNLGLKSLTLNSLKKASESFLQLNEDLEYFEAQNLTDIEDFFLRNNTKLKKLKLNNVRNIGTYFLEHNEILEELEMQSLSKTSLYFLCRNKNLKVLKADSLEETDLGFLMDNTELEEISLKNLRKVRSYFLRSNVKLKKAYFPNLVETDYEFLYRNNSLEEINLDSLKKFKDVLVNNTTLKSLNLKTLLSDKEAISQLSKRDIQDLLPYNNHENIIRIKEKLYKLVIENANNEKTN